MISDNYIARYNFCSDICKRDCFAYQILKHKMSCGRVCPPEREQEVHTTEPKYQNLTNPFWYKTTTVS